MTQRALLVGSSFSAAPIFFALKARGFHVAVCGALAGDPCHRYADASHFIDYSRREDLLALVEAESFDWLVPTCNDFAYLSAAWVAERRGYPGFDPWPVAHLLHTKAAFREAMAAHGLPSPRCLAQGAAGPAVTGDLPPPYLVKPVDSFSGRGVTRVADPAALPAALAHARAASRTGEAVLEEFVEGRLYSHSAFIRDQAVAADFFVDEYCTVYPYQVNCSHHPSSLPAALRDGVRAAMTRLAQGLGLADGLLHTQFIADGERFWIVECMRRCPGDLYGHLVELSAGAPYTDLFLRPFIGETLPASLPVAEARPVGRHTISRAVPLVPYSFSCRLPEARDLRIVPLKDSGQPLDPAPFDKLAIVFAEFADAAAMAAVTPHFAERVDIHPHAPWTPAAAPARKGTPC